MNDDGVITMYRIMEVKNGEPYTLFHGVNGSRKVRVGQWITAEKKTVHDGTNGTPYTSGFHCMGSFYACLKYLRKFTSARELGIYQIDAKNIYEKAHSRDMVFLADHMCVKERMI